jgi:hypothetical protein
VKADLSGQIHELMERGVRPATMADIKNQAPLRVSMLQRPDHGPAAPAGRAEPSWLP